MVGRGHVLDEFSLALEGSVGGPGRAVLLTGVRGPGKTVALNACEDEAHRRGWAVISETIRPGLGGLSEVDRAFLGHHGHGHRPQPNRRHRATARREHVLHRQYRLRLMSAELITPARHGQVRLELPYMREYLLQAAGDYPPFGPEQAAALHRATFTGEPGISAPPPAPKSAAHQPLLAAGEPQRPGQEG